jgi:hypothetical protein
MKVYLCGAMEGVSEEQANGWRSYVARFYLGVPPTSPFHLTRPVTVLDPCRRKKFHSQPYSVNLAKKIVALDLLDIKTCDIVLANLKDRGAGHAWGSVSEIALASEVYHKPIITVLEAGFHHPFIETFSTEMHTDLDQALEATLAYR